MLFELEILDYILADSGGAVKIESVKEKTQALHVVQHCAHAHMQKQTRKQTYDNGFLFHCM